MTTCGRSPRRTQHAEDGAVRIVGRPDGDLALTEDDLLTSPIWVDTGADQLLVALRIPPPRRAQPDSACLDIWPTSSLGRKTAYVFAFDAERPGTVVSRYFFVKQGSVSEDPGTGSACANLGGWLLR